MTQPKYAPILIEDEVRPAAKLDVPRPWSPHRPSELRAGPRSFGGGAGSPGPDQGYALRLAQLVADRVVLGEGEHLDDALSAAVVVALGRASTFGRAPVLKDLEFGLAAFGYLGPVDVETSARRHRLVSGLAHDYFRQRSIADLCDEKTLRGPLGEGGAFLLAAAEMTA
jgi:hypothetical protein